MALFSLDSFVNTPTIKQFDSCKKDDICMTATLAMLLSLPGSATPELHLIVSGAASQLPDPKLLFYTDLLRTEESCTLMKFMAEGSVSGAVIG